MGQQNLQPDQEDQLIALGRALQTLREEDNADVLIETALNYLAHEFKYRLIWIGLYDRLDHRLFGKGGITPTGDTTFLRQRFNLHPGDLLEQVVIQQRPIGIADLRQETRAREWRRAAQDYGIQGTLVFPLRCKDRCFGVALLGSPLWGVSPRPAEKALLSLLLGGLAASLYQIEVEWQRSSIKRPDQPLFQVLNKLMQVPTLARRLEAVVAMTQEFIIPTRTNLYWYSPERRYFWHRVGSRQSMGRFGDARSSAVGLTVAEANDFYQALCAGQLVAIGTARSMLASESTKHLLSRLRSRSLLASPIQSQGELLGFLAVEDTEARIWEEGERNYVQAAAQLLGLVASNEQLEAMLQETQTDTHFAAEIAQAIAKHCHINNTVATQELEQLVDGNDIQAALRECATLLCKRIEANLFLILQEEDNGQFTIFFGQQPLKRRFLNNSLPPLHADDRRLFVSSADAVMIEDLEQDFKLSQWRECMKELGGRSLLISKTAHPVSSGKLSLLLIGHSTSRTWHPQSRYLVSIVAQQINLLLTLGHYSDSVTQSFQRHQTLQQGLATLSQAPLDPAQFERTWLNYLSQRLECPLAALFSWTPESTFATVAAAVVTDSRFAMSPDLTICLTDDSIIQAVLATHNFVVRSVADLPEPIPQWLSSPGIGQFLVIALHTDSVASTGFILLADQEERHWPRHLLTLLETLTQQFAWFRQYRYLLNQHSQDNQYLQTINWYKHRCLEALHQSITQSISALLDLQAPMPPVLENGGFEQLHLQDLAQRYNNTVPARGQALQQMRHKQLLQQLEQTLAIMTPVLKDEEWQLKTNLRSIPLASLLKRSLRRVELLSNQRRLRVQVHNSNDKSVYGDLLKLDCIFFELLVTVCVHSRLGNHINLWCEPCYPESTPTTSTNLSASMLELLIAESTVLDECLQTLHTSSPMSSFTLNLNICQEMIQSWGGDLQFFQLVGERYLFRLLLPK